MSPSLGRAPHDWETPYRSTFLVRWSVFRHRYRVTWRDWLEDLRYLVIG